MTPTERLLWAYRNGHSWNPARPNLLNLDEGRVNLMRGDEPDARDLIASWQILDANVNRLVNAFHGRELIPDGIIGPASEAVMAFKRCDVPDYAPPPSVALHDDDPERLKMLLKYQAAKATGSGSWRAGCYGTSGVHEIKVSYDESGLSDNQKLWMPEVKRHNAAAVAAMGLKLVEVPVGQFANVRFFAKSYGGSIIGMAEFNDGTCGDSVFCTVTRNYAPSLRMFLILFMHEFGHTMNFEHSNRYIMNPSIMDVPEYWVQRNAAGEITYQDVRYAKGDQFFGGDPLNPPPPPPPPPGPTPGGKLIFRGHFAAEMDGKPLGNFILVPKAEV